MKDLFLKIYVWTLIVMAVLNIFLGTGYRFFPSPWLLAPIYVITLIEIVVWISSVVMIFYVPIKKLEKVHLILPIFYVISFLALAVYGGILTLRGIDVLDMSYFPNIIGYVLSEIFYLFQIVVGAYLLKKK